MSEKPSHTPADQVQTGLGLLDRVGVEPETGARNRAISRLSLDLLHQFNSGKDLQKLEREIFMDEGILSGTLSEQLHRSDLEKLNGITDVLRIAWHYKEHPTLQVPDRAMVVKDDKDPESSFNEGEKVLVYISGDRQGAAKDIITFKGKKRVRFTEVPLLRPDVFLQGINDRSGGIYEPNKLSFELSGCDNLIVGKNIAPEKFLKEIALSCNGDLTLLAGTRLLAGGIVKDWNSPDFKKLNRAEITLHAGGDIVQKEGTLLEPRNLSCIRYIISTDNARIVNSTEGKALVKINATEVSYTDGRPVHLDPKQFEVIGDPDYLVRQGDLVEAITTHQQGDRIRTELPGNSQVNIHAETGGEDEKIVEVSPTESKTPEALQLEFDKVFKSHMEVHRKDTPTTTTILRSYNISAESEKFTKFMLMAIAAGWKCNATQVGQIMAVVLEKSKISEEK